MKAKAIVDPHPRTVELLFNKEERKRLRSLATLRVWEGSRMPPDMVEKYLPEASVVIGQTDLPRARLGRAKKLKAIINVEGNFQPNIDYEECFQRGIHVLGVGVAFGQAVAEMALGFAIALARTIGELRLAGIETTRLAAHDPDLARLQQSYARELEDAALADRAAVYRLAIEAVHAARAGEGLPPPLGLPLLLLLERQQNHLKLRL